MASRACAESSPKSASQPTPLQARFVNGFMYTRLRPLLRPDHAATKLPPEPSAPRRHPPPPGVPPPGQGRGDRAGTRPWVDVAHAVGHPTQARAEAAEPPLPGDQSRGRWTTPTLGRHVAELLEYCRTTRSCTSGCTVTTSARSPAISTPPGLGHPSGRCAPGPRRCLAVDVRSGAAAGPPPDADRREAGAAPTTLDDVRAVSPEAAATARPLPDRPWPAPRHPLRHRRAHPGRAARERSSPASSMRSSRRPSRRPRRGSARCGPGCRKSDRAAFDVVLGDARAVMDMRDDNGPLTYEWPAGLLRGRCSPWVGGWCHGAGLPTPEHALELTPAEAATVLDRDAPSGAELTRARP